MNNFFSVKKFSKPPKDLLSQLKSVATEGLYIDLSSFPMPLQYLVIKKSYYERIKEDLESFTRIIDKIFISIIREQNFVGLGLNEKEKEILENYNPEEYTGALLRLDCALSNSGCKIMEINARHPFGPGGFFLYDELLRNNCDKANDYIRFDFEKTIFKKFKSLISKDQTLCLVYQPGKITESAIQEVQFLTKLFNSWGLNSFLVSLTDFKFKNNRFYYKKQKVNCVYRWFEMQNLPKNTLSNFQRSVEAGELRTINDFSSLILGNKNFLAQLSEGKYNNYLSDREKKLYRKLIPRTVHLNKTKIKFLQKHKNDYLLKESRGTEGRNIIFGTDLSDKEWSEILNRLLSKNYVAQRVVALPEAELRHYLSGEIVNMKVCFDFDPYFVDNKICGYISRASINKITNYNAGGILTATLIEK
ncbi:glutathionylspermidine synthase family protein [Patescibacteria group bacterium]